MACFQILGCEGVGMVGRTFSDVGVQSAVMDRAFSGLGP